jgi:hypothetical protein
MTLGLTLCWTLVTVRYWVDTPKVSCKMHVYSETQNMTLFENKVFADIFS